MQSGDQQAGLARQLLAGVFHGVLSTHSVEHPGYPFGSVVPYALGRDGSPLLLLSHLSQHTKNVDTDRRCSLTILQTGDGDVQELARLNAIGETLPLPAVEDGERYFAYYPHARPYLDDLGFRFYRFQPLRFHWNGGFATARWYANERLVRTNPLDAKTEARIVAHMNSDHVDALRAYLAHSGIDDTGVVAMVGIDAEGMDLRVAGQLKRIPLLRPIADADEARRVLVEMAG